MTVPRFRYQGVAPIAFMGGIYGNIPALEACLGGRGDVLSFYLLQKTHNRMDVPSSLQS